MAIDFQENTGSPTEYFRRDSMTAKQEFIVDWDDRVAFAIELLQNGGQAYRHHGNGFVRAVGVGTRPHPGAISADGTTQYGRYEKALLSVEYSTPTGGGKEPESDQTGRELYTERIEPSVEFLTLPTMKSDASGMISTPLWTWQNGDAVTVEQAPGILIKSIAYIRTVHNVSHLSQEYLDANGKINANKIKARSLGISFPKETLLFSIDGTERTVTTQGVGSWAFSFRFTYRPDGWNKFYRWDTNTWQQLKFNGLDYEPYKGRYYFTFF